MIPIDQTIVGSESGNCFAACIASVLEMPLETIPQPLPGDMDDDAWEKYFERVYHYLDRTFGLGIIDVSCTLEESSKLLPGVYVMPYGPSPRLPDSLHSVVARDGKIIHDPLPEGKRLDRINGVSVFVVVDPSKLAGGKNE